MFSATVLRLSQAPKNMGGMEEPDATGVAGAPGEGPYMTISLRAQCGRITDARFETYGCPAAIACGSWITEWLKSKTLEQAQLIEPAELAALVGGLPLGKEHCAQLAVHALRRAIVKGVGNRQLP